nr:MAG TPA: Replicative helicase [Caudoviricetes sp.]
MNVDALINSIAKKAEPVRDLVDYEKDGLLYCGHCNTPKQCRIPIGGNVRLVGCQCACAAREYEAEKKARADREKRLRIETLRADGIRDKSLTACRFDKATMSEEIVKCKRYADAWDDMRRENSGLLLWGNTGNGKTFAAACIANELIDRGIPAMITSFPRILNAGYDKQETIEQVRYYPLLVIDDLGAERSSEYAMETVYTVIDERYKSKKPLIVTTNLTLDELCKPKNMDYQRIYDRVIEMCTPLVFKGDNLRRDKANKRLRYVKSVLEGSNGH